MSPTHLVRRSQSTAKDLVGLIRQEIAEQLGRLGLATRADLADLEHRLRAELAGAVAAPPATPAVPRLTGAPATKKTPAKKAPVNKTPAKTAPAATAVAKTEPVKKAPVKKAPAAKAPAAKAPQVRAPKTAASGPDLAAGSDTPAG